MNFDQEFRGGLALRSSKLCSYRVPASAVINISHGNRLAKKGSGSSAGGSNGRGQAVSSSGAARYPSPKKPMAVVPPLDPSSMMQPQQPSGPPMPGITPPDPKNLPNPMLLFGKQDGKKSGKQNDKKPARNPPAPGVGASGVRAGGEPDVMQNLWKSLENSTREQNQQPPVRVMQRQQPPQATMATEEAMSRDLTNMLNIRPQGAAAGKSSVEAFFAAAAASASGGNALQKPPPMPTQQREIDADSSFCKRLMGMLESHEYGQPRYTFSEGEQGLPVATVVLPWGDKYEGSEERDRDSAAESAAQLAVDAFEAKRGPDAAPKQSTAFVPMQVARKIVRTKSVGEKKKKQKAEIKLDPREAGGADRVAEWVMASQGQESRPPPNNSAAGNEAAAAPAAPQGRQNLTDSSGRGRGLRGGGRGRGVVRQPQGPAPGQQGFGRGQRKPRLAANFGGPPS